MPLLSDRGQVRGLLQKDATWAAYALGDLGPDLWPHTRWYQSEEEVALVLRAFHVPILWAAGALDRLVGEINDEPRYSVQIRPSALPALERHYRIQGLKKMWRMTVAAEDFRPAAGEGALRLSEADVPALEVLYRDGAEAGESPEFFFGPMVSSGVFFGGRDANGLTAVAGTHLVELAEGIAAIGNVYTRRDCRGQGWSARLTSAVVTELRRLGVAVIVLNVYQSNGTARRVYERLGFRRHCEFVEGIIERH